MQACQRYWTAGGALRDVPVGAGRRKSKALRGYETIEMPAGLPLPGLLPGALVLDPLAAFSMAAGQPVSTVMPSALLPSAMALPAPPPMVLPHVEPFPGPPNGVAHELVARLAGGAAEVGGPGGRPEPAADAAAEYGATEGRRTRAKVAAAEMAAGAEPARSHQSGMALALGGCGQAMPSAGGAPYGSAAMDWLTAAAAQNPQAAAAMQAQFQAAAGYGSAQFGMPPGMWPYPAFPPTWAATYPRFPGFNPMDPAAAAAGMVGPPAMGPADGAPVPGMHMQGGPSFWPGMPPPAWPPAYEHGPPPVDPTAPVPMAMPHGMVPPPMVPAALAAAAEQEAAERAAAGLADSRADRQQN
jgi:hypothetical protein